MDITFTTTEIYGIPAYFVGAEVFYNLDDAILFATGAAFAFGLVDLI